MPDTDGVFPDDVPIADAIEQQRATADSAADDERAASSWEDGQVPLEASASDWQEQRESVLLDPDLEEFDADR
ncbi:hypothetical protein [Mycobacterium angelicum]|uniref:Uncharacterized protein n=1 Tax=Mycobacterium angelicum TaxID=470074 RepID=A0A1X0A6U8_MYCAN|nr:hypothetical protein [Mycobacterium angelicum]MCV7194922.1 hypothetical protein [Mycobacterium angelicum]ORA25763.1 hypothetical protein BST12_01575 [Mycobacterium angelicum]